MGWMPCIPSSRAGRALRTRARPEVLIAIRRCANQIRLGVRWRSRRAGESCAAPLQSEWLLSRAADGCSGSSCDFREESHYRSTELDQRMLCLALDAVPRAGCATKRRSLPTSRVTLSRRTWYRAEGRVTFPLRQSLGSVLSAAPQARDTIPRSHASMRRASLGMQLVSACIRSRLRQARRPRVRLR
jgi:hypothetical protein